MEIYERMKTLTYTAKSLALKELSPEDRKAYTKYQSKLRMDRWLSKPGNRERINQSNRINMENRRRAKKEAEALAEPRITLRSLDIQELTKTYEASL